MATDPFTGAFITRLENRTHAYRFVCELGDVVQFKFYCCDGPYGFSVIKAPVPILTVDPDIQCICPNGVNLVTVNSTGTYSPDGGACTVHYDFGVGAGWAGPFAVGAAQTYCYGTAGTYTITLRVTNAAADTATVASEVLIVDCDEAILAEYMYLISLTTGPWLRDMSGVPPTWVQHIAGLPAAYLVGRDIKIDPHRKHLPVAIRHVWIATQAGVAKSVDNMDNWAQLYNVMPEPRNTDGGAETKAGLDWYCITFNPMARDEVYVLAGTATRGWVYWTTDDGMTWDNWQVGF